MVSHTRRERRKNVQDYIRNKAKYDKQMDRFNRLYEEFMKMSIEELNEKNNEKMSGTDRYALHNAIFKKRQDIMDELKKEKEAQEVKGEESNG